MEVDDEFTKRLRAVFNLCDTEHRGFISVDYFVDLAKEHFGSGDWNSSQEVCILCPLKISSTNFYRVNVSPIDDAFKASSASDLNISLALSVRY